MVLGTSAGVAGLYEIVAVVSQGNGEVRGYSEGSREVGTVD